MKENLLLFFKNFDYQISFRILDIMSEMIEDKKYGFIGTKDQWNEIVDLISKGVKYEELESEYFIKDLFQNPDGFKKLYEFIQFEDISWINDE